jgi:hypothetical protein
MIRTVAWIIASCFCARLVAIFVGGGDLLSLILIPVFLKLSIKLFQTKEEAEADKMTE